MHSIDTNLHDRGRVFTEEDWGMLFFDMKVSGQTAYLSRQPHGFVLGIRIGVGRDTVHGRMHDGGRNAVGHGAHGGWLCSACPVKWRHALA